MPSSPYSSVEQARKILAARLAGLQHEAGIRTGREMARRLGWQPSKVSRIVNAVTPPSESDIAAWCAACGAAAETPGLVSALRMAAGAYVEWRRMERHGLRAAQESVAPLYDRTRLFRFYSSCVLPGLAQTADYTESVLRNVQARRGLIDDIPEAVRVRMDRQRVLDDLGRSFVFVVEESVLRTNPGSPEMMAEQLGYLLSLVKRPNVRLGVIPWTMQRRLAPTEMFFLHDSAEVAVELVSAYLTITQPTEVALYEQAFEELSDLAVFGPGVRSMIGEALRAVA
jgi:transcriptional regulator with XRE-family HTH domain